MGELQKGTIVQVYSGDTVFVLDEHHRQETKITFTYVVAPLLARYPNANLKCAPKESQPYAWEAWNALRKFYIGKPVLYEVDQRILDGRGAPPDGGVYGAVWINEGGVRGLDVAEDMVKRGFVTVAYRGAGERHRFLLETREEAERLGRGRWSGDREPTGTIDWLFPHMTDFYNRHFRIPTSGVILAVHGVTTFGVVLWPGKGYAWPGKVYACIALTGVKGPCAPPDGTRDPTYDKARFCSTFNFLHRDIMVTIEGRRDRLLFASVMCAEVPNVSGNVSLAEFLLRKGVVNVDEDHRKLHSDMGALRRAESEAREDQLRLRKSMLSVPEAACSVRGSQQALVDLNSVKVEKAAKLPADHTPTELSCMPEWESMNKTELFKALMRAKIEKQEADMRIQELEKLAEEGSRRTEATALLRRTGLLRPTSALHARSLIEDIGDWWTNMSEVEGTDQLTLWPRWDRIIEERGVELQAVIVDHEQLIPPDVFPNLREIMKDIHKKCNADIHRLHLLENRVLINGDRLGEIPGKVLMALCTCYGLAYTFVYKGTVRTSRMEVTRDHFPMHSTDSSRTVP